MESYRPMTLAELATLLRDASESLRWKLFAEFLEEHRWEPMDGRAGLLADEPPTTGHDGWDVLLASLAEHLCAVDGLGAPAWTEDRHLATFWFPFSTAAARCDALVTAPAAFRRRGVFLAASELLRA